MTINIKAFVQREIVYCVSTLIYELTKQHKLDDDTEIELWTGTLDPDRESTPDEEFRNEVFEHWIVTEWLAEKLRKHGETVVEFMGLTVWCRCTTGQAIWMDYVIQQIYLQLTTK